MTACVERYPDMKRRLWLVPFLGLAAFAAYYNHWNSLHAATVLCKCKSVHRNSPEPTMSSDDYAHRDGRKEAEADLRHGKLMILTYGLQAPWSLAFMEVLHRDHGVELRTVAGCIVTGDLMRYVDAYNEVMERHLISVHGKDFFDREIRKARAFHAERMRALAVSPASGPG